jgi:hypothetical protein
MRVAAERGISYPSTLHLLGRFRASAQLWGLSRELTRTMGSALALWTMAIARTKFGVRKKDFIKQKVLVSAWTTSVSRERTGKEVPPRAWRHDRQCRPRPQIRLGSYAAG